MTIHFSTLTNADMSNNGRAAFVNTLMAEAGGNAAVTPVDQSTNYPVSGSITFNGTIYSLPNNATQFTWGATATVAWDEDAGVLVIMSGTTPTYSTNVIYNDMYASCYVYVLIAGGHLWWGSGTHDTTIADAFNIGTGMPRAAADTTRAMLTPLIADGIDMTPVFISQNFVIDTAGTTVTDTAGNRFVSLGNLLYIQDAVASEPAGTAVTCRIGSVSTLPAGAQATVTNSGTLNDVVLDFGIPAGAAGPKGDKGDKGDAGTGGSGYTLPAATSTTLGGVKVGDNLTITDDGTLSASGDGVAEFGTDSLAVGTTPDTSSTTTNTVAVGDGASTTNNDCVAVGTTATTGGAGNTIIGSGAVGKAQNSTVLGYHAATTTTDGTDGGTAVGAQAAADNMGVAVGQNAKASKHASIAVGANSSCPNDHSMAVGANATVKGDYTLAVGASASGGGWRSVALGAYSATTEDYTVSVGSGTVKRRVVNVADPTAAQDAATKAYVDSLIAKLKSDNGLK